LIAIFVRFMKK